MGGFQYAILRCNTKYCSCDNRVIFMSVTSVRIPDDLLAELEQTAEKLQRSKSWLINDAVKQYLANENYQQQQLIETQEALEDVKAGRLIEGEAVMDWLDTWGTDKEVNPPK